MSLIFNSDGNKIGDRGCQYIGGGGWLRMKEVGVGICLNSSDTCSVREEGCRAIAKWQGYLELISCILVVTKVHTTKSKLSAPTS